MQAGENVGAFVSKDTVKSAGEFEKGSGEDSETLRAKEMKKDMTAAEAGTDVSDKRGYETYTYMSKEDQNPSGVVQEESIGKGRPPAIVRARQEDLQGGRVDAGDLGEEQGGEVGEELGEVGAGRGEGRTGGRGEDVGGGAEGAGLGGGVGDELGEGAVGGEGGVREQSTRAHDIGGSGGVSEGGMGGANKNERLKRPGDDDIQGEQVKISRKEAERQHIEEVGEGQGGP